GGGIRRPARHRAGARLPPRRPDLRHRPARHGWVRGGATSERASGDGVHPSDRANGLWRRGHDPRGPGGRFPPPPHEAGADGDPGATAGGERLTGERAIPLAVYRAFHRARTSTKDSLEPGSCDESDCEERRSTGEEGPTYEESTVGGSVEAEEVGDEPEHQ